MVKKQEVPKTQKVNEMDKDQTVIELDKLADQAATWFQRMSDKSVSEETQVAFDDWIAADETHKVAYEEYSAIWHHPEFDNILQNFADEEKRVPAYQKVPVYHKPIYHNKSLLTVRKIGTIAASLLLLFSTWLFFESEKNIPVQSVKYQTEIGEIKTVTLMDGSTVALNTDTKIRISFGEQRKIYLQQGEAYFDVKKDGREFIIEGGTGRIKVLGTAFNARVSYNQMIVVVDRGVVSVGPDNSSYQQKTLHQHEKLAVTDRRLGSVRKVVKQVADWRDGWIEFNDRSLAEVITELDRYYAGEIRLAERNLWQLRVTGRFNLKDIKRAVGVLGKSMRLNVIISENDEIIIG